jgi:L-iditol 2-dehydrogenase
VKAARLYGQKDVRIEDVGVPFVGDGEVLVRIRAGQICGTDVRMYGQGVKPGGAVVPLTLGHEIAGIVAEIGSGVTGLAVGARVAVAPNYGCGVCDMCVGGNSQMCAYSQALGVTLDGGFAEYMRVPAPAVSQGNISELPDNVSFQDAALAEPLSCVYNAFERNDPQPGDVVVILGSGPIGLMHAKLYLMAGAGSVIMNDLRPERLDLCREMEPDILTASPETLADLITEISSGRGADIVITAAPAPATHQLALELVAINGKVSFFGGLPRDREIVPINTNLIHYKQIWVTGTTRQNLRQYRKTLDLIARGQVSLNGMITRTVPLEQIDQVLQDTMEGRGLKNGILIEA